MKHTILVIAALVVVQLELSTAAECTDMEAPEFTTVRPALTSAAIIVRAINVASCDLTEAIVRCANDATDNFERSVSISNSAEWVTVDVDNLEPDTVYICSVRWTNSPFSLPIRFRTRDLIRRQLSISDVTQTGFKVSWTEDYDPEFVLNNQLQFSGGTKYPPRLDCDHLGPIWITHDFDRTVYSFAFEDGFPSFVYTAQLVTTYNLSVQGYNEVSLLEVVFLDEAEPAAPDDLTVDFRCEGNAGYNVTAVVSWLPPCKLNGELSGFDVAIDIFFVQGDLGGRFSTSIPADSPNRRYSHELREISPLFRYVVSINTLAAARGPASEVQMTPPDAEFCTRKS